MLFRQTPTVWTFFVFDGAEILTLAAPLLLIAAILDRLTDWLPWICWQTKFLGFPNLPISGLYLGYFGYKLIL
jgi:hypothetical protein